jgi:hypothetical protein
MEGCTEVIKGRTGHLGRALTRYSQHACELLFCFCETQNLERGTKMFTWNCKVSGEQGLANFLHKGSDKIFEAL